ncbi:MULTISPECIES: SRPBCC family protein [Methylorubrum]|uniref:SRPBCC family protein n=1 Tax=Methylorubrum TaxID=2282523 RepID=UPI00209FFAF6|nr:MULTISPECIES: carbon monoxide dehydrogenase subunit G [Methylorubrum]MCP1551064.1 carbon monoxide dehydrogenase subunit G [Methylorubrum zatmanii]MCP1552322.1 carbon monoxide dehydrogenase subunit G [Methylorubrum extorquens]MCP1581368.1 carbon monoxide dehydrogenase subunit G [Methylorubrum extorquens]
MDITGEYRIAAPRAAVWAALNDPEVLARCIPGCKELTQASPEELAAKVALKVGPVSATFAGTVRFEDIRAPEGYTLVGQGNGGMAGFAKGRAVVSLREEGADTVLTYEAKAEIGGKIASLGGRLIQGTSRKLADQFFGTFTAELGAPVPASEAAVAAP